MEKEDLLVEGKRVELTSLIVGDLYTVKKDFGYIKRKDLMRIIDDNPILLESPYLEKPTDIIVKRNAFVKNYISLFPVKEFLTNTQLDSVVINPESLKNSLNLTPTLLKKELDTFVYIPSQYHPDIIYLWDYVEKHIDIEAYRMELERKKEQGKSMHFIKKELELDEFFHIK